jgi:3-deoxy-D-manno-octulosonate 8-phosphate phosphatase (KDO 8-P phosphatase)
MDLLDQFKRIKTFVFDVDGVLTDSSVLLLENGLQARRMSIKDGLALQLALRNGYRVLILSGAHSDPVVQRMQYLGLTEIHTAVKDKKGFLEQYCSAQGIERPTRCFSWATTCPTCRRSALLEYQPARPTQP